MLGLTILLLNLTKEKTHLFDTLTAMIVNNNLSASTKY